MLHVVLVQWDRNFFSWFLNCVGFFSFWGERETVAAAVQNIEEFWIAFNRDFFLPRTAACSGQPLFTHTESPPNPFLLIQNDRRSPELILQQNHSIWSTQTVTLSQSLKSGELPSLLVLILSRGRMENWQQGYKSTEEWSVQMQMSW